MKFSKAKPREDGARLADVIDGGNTASDVWADTAYRSAKNEAMLAGRGLVSPQVGRARRRRARLRPPEGPIGLVVRTIGMARARVKIGLAA